MAGALRSALTILTLLLAAGAYAQGWMQWGRTAQHDSASPAVGQKLDRIEAEIVLDPFAGDEKAMSNGNLLVHYQVPLVDGDDLFLVQKSGLFTGPATRETQTWNVTNVRRVGNQLVTRWTFTSDWKPVPTAVAGGPGWELVYHCALSTDALWAPGAGGTIDKISRSSGALLVRFNPFGTSIDPRIFVAGPPSIDDQGNVYYNAIQLDPVEPWMADPVSSWLVRIGANGSVTKATFRSLVTSAPDAEALCTTSFSNSDLPFPPTPNAIAPVTRCTPQRPGINSTPAVAADGTIYTVSRAHRNDRWSYLVAVNPDLTPKWSSSLRNRFSDGCNVTIPPNGTPGGCRIGATTGVDPTDNQPGSGRVVDDATSSPVVTPDGRILYGAYTRYNYSQGHLMMFAADGRYLGAYGFGWDLTPAIHRHDGTYSILLKENRYNAGSYCFGEFCPPRNLSAPFDPEQYFITRLDSSLRVEWKFKNTTTLSCERDPTGALRCVDDHPLGFEWCVNAIAVDRRGIVYANSEDGYLYAIDPSGVMLQRIFLRLALGAAYTPLSIGPDGRIYTQNDGNLFIVEEIPPVRRRAVRR